MKLSWQEELRNNICSAQELFEKGYISKKTRDEINKVEKSFPMSVPRYYLSLIEKFDDSDPIYKMAIARANELQDAGRFDTSGELENTVTEGVQHKYLNTSLILSTNICAMYCRHCFRKRLVGLTEDEVISVMEDALKYISIHKEIDNVLISGGDSFLNSNKVLERYLSSLCEMDHIKFIRFGTRTPVVFPQRIIDDSELLAMLQKYSKRKSIIIVTQFNHPKEITPESTEAIRLLRERGIPILNQAVLLNEVNTTPSTLSSLFNNLLAIGVKPYYLFQCRPVKGVKEEYALPLLEAVELVEETRSRLSGVAKSFRFIMSHISGKIEILGETEGKLILKRHQAKEKELINQIMLVDVRKDSRWLPDEFEAKVI